MALERRLDLFVVDLAREITRVVEADGRGAEAVPGGVEIDRGRRVVGRPGGGHGYLALLAARAPVGHPGLLAVAADLDRRAATEARLPVPAVDGHAFRTAGQGGAARLVEVGLEERRRGVQQREAGVQVEGAHGRQRVHAAGPEHLALVDVADTGRDALIEEHLGRGGGLVAELRDALHRAGDVDGGVAEIGPEQATTGMRRQVTGAERLHHGGVEADGLEALHLDGGAHVAGALAPALPRPVQVPRPGHPHVGVQDDPVVPADLDVLAPAVHPLDDRAERGAGPGEAWRLEPGHHLLQQRSPQRRGRPVDRVTLGHAFEATRPGPGCNASLRRPGGI